MLEYYSVQYLDVECTLRIELLNLTFKDLTFQSQMSDTELEFETFTDELLILSAHFQVSFSILLLSK